MGGCLSSAGALRQHGRGGPASSSQRFAMPVTKPRSASSAPITEEQCREETAEARSVQRARPRRQSHLKTRSRQMGESRCPSARLLRVCHDLNRQMEEREQAWAAAISLAASDPRDVSARGWARVVHGRGELHGAGSSAAHLLTLASGLSVCMGHGMEWHGMATLCAAPLGSLHPLQPTVCGRGGKAKSNRLSACVRFLRRDAGASPRAMYDALGRPRAWLCREWVGPL
jgi:hypothetical protein